VLHAKFRNRTCQGLDRQGQGQGPSLQEPGQGQGLDLQGQGQGPSLQGPGQRQGLDLQGQGQGLLKDQI